MRNKYIHPHLFKGTRLTQERRSEDLPGKLVQMPAARLWADVRGIEELGDPELVLGDGAPAQVTLIIHDDGYFYVTDDRAQVLEAWEYWLNEAYLRHKNVLSN